MEKLHRLPTTPGEILREEFMRPMKITQIELASHIGCDVKVINRIVNQRSRITAPIAVKLAAAFRTTPDFWLNAQQAVDLYVASREISDMPKPFSRTITGTPFVLT